MDCRSTFGGSVYRNPVTLTQITDGLSKTVLLGEVGVVENARDRPFGVKANVSGWTGNGTTIQAQPAPSQCLNANTDWVTPNSYILDFGYGHGMGWLMPDPAYTGFFTILPPNTPACAAGTDINGTNGTISSNHPGGACVVMCDGAVRFIADTIDCGDLSVTPPTVNNDSKQYKGPSMWGVWGALGTISRGEQMPLTE